MAGGWWEVVGRWIVGAAASPRLWSRPSVRREIVISPRREINSEMQVQACHPKSAAAARRCPVPLFQFFSDSPELFVDGNLADAFK